MKEYLDGLVEKYETKDFIKDDPVQFAHAFKNKKDIEIASFIAALFAFGKREAFISKLKHIFKVMQNEPYNFILNFSEKNNLFCDFVYRFVKGDDLKSFLLALNKLYKHDKSTLEELFYTGYCSNDMLGFVSKYFYSTLKCPPNLGFCHRCARPEKGGAMQRMNMYLRWMIRSGPVDMALWDFLKKCELLIPLDVHVGNVSRSLGLLGRNANDFKSVIELTQKLMEFDSDDPVKYDFALFGVGVNSDKKEKIKIL